MNIHQSVEYAVQNALVVGAYAESFNDFSAFADKDDDYEVHFDRESLPDADYQVTIDASETVNLRKLLEAYADITGNALNQDYVEYTERHERLHFVAAKYLGAVSARAGILIERLEQPGRASRLSALPFLKLPNFKTTKLGAALILGYPLPPSPGDMVDIKAYGYSGIEEIADIAMRRNIARKNASGLFYPVPLGSGGDLEGYPCL